MTTFRQIVDETSAALLYLFSNKSTTDRRERMLILDRMDGQSILIGSNIIVKILRTSDGKTRVGISAPEQIRILRDELEGKYSANNPLRQFKNH
jgi:carbon storage regulator